MENSKKVIVGLSCGLANRMFQYSYYLYLLKHGCNASVDYIRSAALKHEKVLWNDIFPKATYIEASRYYTFFVGGGDTFFEKIRRKFFPWSTNVIDMNTSFDFLKSDDIKNGSYCRGVFQNAQMVEEICEEVSEKFEFTPLSGEKNLHLAERLNNCESVAIHVRKGEDYMARDWYHNTCTLSYYLDAVDEIKKRVPNPHFFVFADNPEWVKKHFVDKGFDFELIDWNPSSGHGNHLDMQLMSLCKHNIISNSTYSWWGAFLNKNSTKVVVAPHYWFNPEGNYPEVSSDRLLLDKWISL